MKATSAAEERPYRERLRDDLLGIACRIVAAEGLAALQARRIATEAGCAVGTIYNVFGDLDGLILAANEVTLDLMSVPLTQVFAASEGLPKEQRLLALAEAYLEFARARPLQWRAVFEHRLQLNHELPEAYVEKRARLLSLIEKAIVAEVRDAELRRRAARALFAAVHGIILLAFDNKLQPFNKAETEREIRFIVGAAAAGIGKAA